MRRDIASILFLNFVNMLGFSLLIPILPFVVKQYGGHEIMYGVLLSLFSAFQFLGSPVLGSLSDKYGRKPLLIISHTGTLVGWMIFAAAFLVPDSLLYGISLPLMLIALARVADGITGGNMSVASAYVSDITSPKERTVVYGYTGAVIGLAILVGPALGSLAASTSIGYLGTAYLAVAVSFVTLIFLVLFLQESLPKEDREPEIVMDYLQQINFFSKLMKFKDNKFVMRMFGIRFFYNLVFSAYASVIVLYLVDTFHFDQHSLGFFLLFVGTFIIINQAFVVKFFVRLLGDVYTLVFSVVLTFVGLFLITTTTNLVLYVLFYYLLNLGFSLSLPSYKSLLSNAIGKTQQGEIMGIDESLVALTATIAPFVASYAFSMVKGQVFVGMSVLLMVSFGAAWFTSGDVFRQAHSDRKGD